MATSTSLSESRSFSRAGGSSSGGGHSNWSSGTSFSTSNSFAPTARALLLPEEIRALPPSTNLIFKAKLATPILAQRRPFTQLEGLSRTYLPDPYYDGPLSEDFQFQPFGSPVSIPEETATSELYQEVTPSRRSKKAPQGVP